MNDENIDVHQRALRNRLGTKPLSEMTKGNELLLRAVINAAIRVVELNGVSKEELAGVEHCFCNCKDCTRLEASAR